MLFEEFKKLTSCNDYDVYNQFNDLYMAADMNKADFCKAVRPVVASIMKEKKQDEIRLARVKIDTCPNGNDIYAVYVVLDQSIATGKYILQYAGFIGIGCADFRRPYTIMPGRPELTRAEKKELSTWDVHENNYLTFEDCK